MENVSGEKYILSIDNKSNKVYRKNAYRQCAEYSNNKNVIQRVRQDVSNISTSDLHILCEMYCDGANINFEDLYSEMNFQKVSLPTYKFSGKDYGLSWLQTALQPMRKTIFIEQSCSAVTESGSVYIPFECH